MSIDTITVASLRLLALIFTAIALTCLVDPRLLLEAMEVGLETPSALAEARAGYSGTFLGLALLCATGAQRAEARRLALGVVVLVLGIFTLARILSWLIDGEPNLAAMVNHGLEGVGFFFALVLWVKGGGAPAEG